MVSQPQSQAPLRQCERCGRSLPVIGEKNAIILVSAFPEMVLNCLIHLQHGPGALPCQTCNHVNRLGLPQAIVGPDVRGLVFMPEHINAGTPEAERALKAFRQNFNEEPVVVYDARNFRKTFIEMFLLPAHRSIE